MTLALYNTLTRSKETFVPLDADRVTMYVCGPTVYNFIHIGNARPAVVFDTLFRLLKRRYANVVYARNITDIDDRINNAAKARGESIAEFAARYAVAYREDTSALNVLPPTMEPHATHHVPEMIRLVESLLAMNNAYVADGHVLFNVPSMADYGHLSRRDRKDMIAGARVEVAPYKKDPADFVLWKPSTPDLPGWESPWGRGRPGWHLECSAMAEKHLGDTIDIHGGGQDLIFPHHENEIAQSQCAHHGKPLARYWLHNGFLNMNTEKMSKSLGNVAVLRDLLKAHHGETLRYVLLSAQYRQPLDWNDEVVANAKASLDRFYNALRDTHEVKPSLGVAVPAEVEAALDDDLNTPLALARLHEITTTLNRAQGEEASQAKSALLAAGDALGLLSVAPEAWFRWQPQAMQAKQGLSDEEIELLIAERDAAKKSKDFVRADGIRTQLTRAGIALEDTAGGTRWKRS